MCEVGVRWPSTTSFRGKSLFFFLSHLTEDQMQKLITKLIFHQIPLLPWHWENIHWCQIMYETLVVQCGMGWLTDRFETPAWVFITPQALPAYLTACSHEEATWTHTSTAVTVLPAVSTNRVWDWSSATLFPPLRPHKSSHLSLQHQNLRGS